MQSREEFVKSKLTEYATSYKVVATFSLLAIADNDFKRVKAQYETLNRLLNRIYDFIKISCPDKVYQKVMKQETDDLPDYMSPFITVDTYNKILAIKYLDMDLKSVNDKIIINKMSISFNYSEEIPYINLANILYENKKYPEAIEVCEFLKTITQIPPMWEISGKVYRELGYYGEAIEAYTRYLELNENDAEAEATLDEIYEEAFR